MLDGHRAQPMALQGRRSDAPQLGLRHLRVGLVVEVRHLARDAAERHDGARARVAHTRGQPVERQRLRADPDVDGARVDRPAGDRRHQCELVARRELAIGPRVLAVDGHHDRKPAGQVVERGQRVGHPRAVGQLQLDRVAAGALAQLGEEPDTHKHRLPVCRHGTIRHVICPACQTENPDGANFCLNCGTPLRAPGPRREERRTVTVLFADMVGFTDLGERIDQESLRRVMDRFYAEMRGAIEAQGGSVAKFIGDAVMAVWGTPVVREDDALRAVRAAEAMRRALTALNDDLERRWGVRVGMRTGVNTGEVVVDTQRPADLLVGDTLNVAARLEQAATDGEVLVGPDTYRLVRGEARLEPRAPLNLKGKARALSTWRLIDGSRPERQAEPRMTAPLVAREAELERLRGAFGEAVAARECRLVTIVGSPGVGKSRLAAELADVLGSSARVLAARCEPAAEGTSLGPATQILRGGAGIEDDDDPGVVRDKL